MIRRLTTSTTALAVAAALAPAPVLAQAGADDLPSLEQLLNQDVTTAGRRAQKLLETPSAVFVITAEDLKRSGVVHLADAFAMVPGMQVGRTSEHNWAISARGFAGEAANKLLVMVDGRSVYAPIYSGVNWDTLDYLLADIERIEIVRGPGASLWGVNAVNGVINIITRNAADTRGGYVQAAAGSPGQGNLGARYGAALEGGGAWRLSSRVSTEEPIVRDDTYAGTRFRTARLGGRLDRPVEGGDLMLTGDGYNTQSNRADITGHSNSGRTGFNGVGRYSWRGDGHTSQVQLSFTRTHDYDNTLRETRDTFDAEFQQQRRPWRGHDVVFGGGLRYSRDDIQSLSFITFMPGRQSQQHANFFIQDEIDLVKDAKLTLGSKFEHNHYTGWEIQPTGRLAWHLAPQQMVWGGISRAARTPARAERSVEILPGAITIRTGDPLLVGNVLPPAVPVPFPPGFAPVSGATASIARPNVDSEKMTTVELGHRGRLGEAVSYDIAAYRSRYTGLRTPMIDMAAITAFPDPVNLGSMILAVPIVVGNTTDAVSHGVEAAIDFRPAVWWRIQGAYTQQHIRVLQQTLPITDWAGSNPDGALPRHQYSLRNGFDLTHRIRLDVWLRHVSRLPAADVPAYTTADVQVTWRPRHDLELAVVGRNLFDPAHREARGEFFFTVPMEIRRSIFLQGRYWF